MPYCAQCGKMITDEIMTKNNGECDECYLKVKTVDPQLLRAITQSSDALNESCTYCATLTSVHCEKCHNLLC